MSCEYTIYTLTDPRNSNIFYIGATCQPLERRLSQHCSIPNWIPGAILKEKFKLIRHLKRWNKRPIITAVETTTYENVDAREKYYYEYFKNLGHKIIQSPLQFSYCKQQKRQILSLLIVLLCVSCQQTEKQPEYPRTIIYPADCSEEDSMKAAKAMDSVKQNEKINEVKVKEKKIEGKKLKSTLDSLADVVDYYISLRDKSTDSVTWFRWEDSVKAHIAEGQILMSQKVDRISDADNTRQFKQGFKYSPKK